MQQSPPFIELSKAPISYVVNLSALAALAP